MEIIFVEATGETAEAAQQALAARLAGGNVQSMPDVQRRYDATTGRHHLSALVVLDGELPDAPAEKPSWWHTLLWGGAK